MTKGKTKAADKLVTVNAAVPVVIWRANRPLTEAQHDELARKLRAEQEQTGVELILVPMSVDVEVAAEAKAVKEEPTVKDDPDSELKEEKEGEANGSTE